MPQEMILSNTGRPIKYPMLDNEGRPKLLPYNLQVACDMAEADALQKSKQNALWNSLNQFQNAVGSGGSVGMDIPITTMTTIIKEKSEQKFYKLMGRSVSDYIPIKVGGEGAWSDYLLTYVVQQFAGNFEEGIIDMGSPSARLAEDWVGVKGVPVPTYVWAKKIGWNIAQLNAAAKAGNWDLVGSLEEAIKTDFDLGVQRWAFLGGRGLSGNNGVSFGLLNQPATDGITTNTTLITQPISAMNPSQFATFVQDLVGLYLINTNATQLFSHFVIPLTDFVALTTPISPTFPNVSMMTYLEDAFKKVNPNFKGILPLAYCDGPFNSDVFGGNGTQVYALYNFDPKSLRMDVPVPYSFTVPNTLDGWHLASVSYGQVTGLKTYHPQELMYFTFPSPSGGEP